MKILFTRRHLEDVTVLTSFFYFQFLFLEHLQTSSDIKVLIFQTEFLPLTDVLYTFYEYSMFNDIILKINIVLIGYSFIDLE